MRLAVADVAIGVFLAASAFGQYVISAHSGVVQAVRGLAIQPGFSTPSTPGYRYNRLDIRRRQGRFTPNLPSIVRS